MLAVPFAGRFTSFGPDKGQGRQVPSHRGLAHESAFHFGLLVRHHQGGPVVDDGSGPSCTTEESRWITLIGTTTRARRL